MNRLVSVRDSNAPATGPDVVVIGGGALGLATALELLGQGHRVWVLDGAPGESATRAAGGMLSPFTEPIDDDAFQADLTEALRLHPAWLDGIERVSGRRLDRAFPGTILAFGEERAAARSLERIQGLREPRLHPEPLDAEALREREPGLPGLAHRPALYLAGEGYVDPRSLHDALSLAFQAKGGTLRPVHATEVVVRDGRVIGAGTTEGLVSAAVTVNCAGTGGTRFLAEGDRERLDPQPVRGEILRLRPPHEFPGLRHVVQIPDESLYLIPRHDGTVVCGATSVFGDGDRRTTAAGLRALLDGIHGLAGGTGGWEILEHSSGLRPWIRGGRPVFFADERPGLVHGMGLYRNGILLAPVAAARLAAEIGKQMEVCT